MESWTSQTDAEVWGKVREILIDALDKAPEERKTFIDQSCNGDPKLRAEIESLIEASEQPSFVDHPASEAVTMLQSAARSSDDFVGIGRNVGHYELIGKIGQGGMGAVFKAVDLNLERCVALKVLSLGHERYEDKQRFAREAKAASALNHPNIVTIYEFGTQGNFDFIAMEYVEGSTLHDVLAHRLEPLPKLLDYARQAAGALAKAHSAGIVHRDLKPANIMITPDGVVKILDFGLASLVRPEQNEVDPNATRRQELTMAGTIMGTPPYMSPEQAMGERTDFRTDIFSFGSMLYEIICGARPFGGNSPHLTLHQVAMEDPKPMTELNPEAPAELVALVEKCLRKDREQRPQSMAEVHQVLGGTATVMRMTPVVATPVAPVQTGSRRNMMVAGLVSLAAVSIGVLAYHWPTAQPPAGTAALGSSFSYSIETQKMLQGKPTGEPYVASPKDTFEGGWKFRIVMQSPEPGFLYLINQGPDQSGRKRYYILYPSGENEGRAALPANQAVRTGWYVFDENPGTERLWIVWSAKTLPTIEEQLRGPAKGSVETLAAASALDTVLSGLKQGQRMESAGQIRVAMTDRVDAFTEMLELAHR